MHSVGDCSDGAETTMKRTVHERNTRHRLPAGAAASLPDNSIACPVCGVKFRSRKSVYGHMRAHRNRGWRGMQPPAAAAAAAQVIISSTFPATSPSSTISEISSDLLREKSASVREGNPNTVERTTKAELLLDESESTRNAVRKARRNRKTRRLADLEPKSAVGKSHVCAVCGVCCFPTYNALGGHVSVHNRTKNNNISSSSRKNKKKARDDKMEDSESMIRGCRVKKKLHYCAAAAAAAAAGSVLKFDLNELPPIEDDDDEAI